MNLKKLFFLSAACFIVSASGIAQEVLQFRGADRSGIYKESNLLKSWPATGPNLLWECEGIGNGYGSPAITAKNIFIEGEIDTVNYLFALDLTGKIQWKTKIGKEWVINYPGVRTTPTVVNDLVYISTGWGKVACIEANSGKEKWSVDMMKDFHAKKITFGFSESPLIDDNKVFISPGSADTNIVALDRFTGKTLWISKALGEKTAYCSPLLIKLPQRNILVTFSAHALLGIDTKDGKLIWSQKQESEGDVQCNTPYYDNGYIYYITGDGNGSVKLKLSDDGSAITEVWRNKKCDNLFGAFIKVNDYIYTSGYEKWLYYTLDANSGAITDSVKFSRGSIISADNLLYLYNEKGQVGLFNPNGPKLDQISTFKITKGTKAHYSHPVICNGILYIRHGKSLLAYDIKNK
ncbi:MAG: PQQ-like beta-propeller repeat protein [Bacteroidales bacterium]|nr:PQQ-like beta-propeller repeat protein [Bacteroidales bacterium]